MSEKDTKTINVTGMTCAACVSRVEKALVSLDGIETASVNLLSNSAQIIYDSEIVNDKQILKAVEKAGYKASEKSDDSSYMKNEKLIDMRNRFIASLVLALPVFVFAMGHMIPFNSWFPSLATWLMSTYIFPNMLLSNFLQLILTTPIQFVIAYPFYKAAWKSLINKSASMDVLVVLGTSAAYFYSLFSIIYAFYVPAYHGSVFFETAAILLTFIFFGKYLEEIAKGRTSEAIKKLIELKPDTALIIRDGEEVVITIDDVVVGDICVIKPGDSVPVDGIVIEGQTYVNESMITGESVSVFKESNDGMIGGTINENGFIKMEAKKIGKDTTLSQIITMVDEAQTSKIPIQKLADRISAWFVPAVVILSLITLTVWYLLFQFGPLDINTITGGVEAGISSTFLYSFLLAITVLVISCPCALGLATPTAIMVGTGLGAQNGILIRNGEALEIARNVNVVLFDKTGTITEGSPKVTNIVTRTKQFDEGSILRIAASLEKGSEHSIAKAIIQKSEEEKISLSKIEDFKAHPGKGIEAKIDGIQYAIGNRKLSISLSATIEETLEQNMEGLEEQGKTVILVIQENIAIGFIAVSDTIKQNSKDAITMLQQMGLKVAMVSGDNRRAANAIANEVGIDEIHAEVLPEQKVDVVSNYQDKNQKVLFVGDGINDAPALAKADVGIAIGSGTDVAIETGEIILVKDDLRDVVTAIDLSKKTIRKVKMGLFWALIYNTLGIPIAAGFLVPIGFLLPAELAGLAMALSSVSVVINALLLKKYKNPFEKR